MVFAGLSERERLIKAEKALLEIDRRKTEETLSFYTPYPKQQEFHDAGLNHRERMFKAGNRVGKTFCGAAEMAMHLTGRYPDWWLGRRFDRPIKAWAAGKTGLATRDLVQSKLCGSYGQVSKRGTGAIPKEDVNWDKDTSLARGVADALDTVLVTHYTNGVKDKDKSSVAFKSFDQGREKWQGENIDVIWCDEEPPMDIYSEALARLAPTKVTDKSGILYTTFTPLLGKTDLVVRFDDPSPDRSVTIMTLLDADHISEEEKQKMIAGYPAHEREARINGVALLGSGLIFPIATDQAKYVVPPFEIPTHWWLLWGTDFGVDHPFAAALTAHDRDADVIYVINTVRMRDAMPLQHAYAMKQWRNGYGAKIPVAWPQDGWQRKEFEGQLTPLRSVYRKHGLMMLDQHAKFPDGSNSTELGILEMQERFTTGRLKVFSHLTDWLEEIREYHRKDGEIVRVRDDLMSATRVAIMQRRSARQVLWAPNTPDGRPPVQMARDIDNDPWAR